MLCPIVVLVIMIPPVCSSHAALFEISVSRSRNLLHRCYGVWTGEICAVRYATHNILASQKPFKQQ